MILVSLYQNGKHRMGITHTAVTAVSDSGSSKRWTRMWVKVNLRGPSTIISPWLHGLAHSANTWNKENRIPKTKCS